MVRKAQIAGAAVCFSLLVGCGPAAEQNQHAGQAQAAQAPQGLTQAAAVQAQIVTALDPCTQNSNSGSFSRSVCANSSLAALDGQIRTALASRAASMSEDGARLLIENQQHWRDTQRVACGISSDAAAPSAEQQQCLETRFRARTQEAAAAVQTTGGYMFQSVEDVDATPTSRQQISAGADPAITTDIRYPRIDGAQTAQVQRFNALVAQRPQFRPEQGTNETVRYRIAYAGPELISVRFDTSADTPGAAQSNTNVKAVNVVMATGRALTAEDVFRANSGWEDFLTHRAVQEIARQFHDYDNFVPPERDVHETATKPHLWLVTEQALVLLFPPLSFGGSYDMAGAEISIPWADLRPYLNPNAPAPIRPQA